jgi:pilus assembly protein CpaC
MRQFLALLLISFATAAVSLPADAAEVIGEGSKVISIEKNKGVIIRLSRPANTVFVANPEIADIQVKSPRLVYVFGKKPGETTLFAVDDKERVLANLRLEVKHNLSRLRTTLKTILPDALVAVSTVGDSILLKGSVRTALDAAEVRRIARKMVDKPENIIMQLAITGPTQVQLRVRVAEVSRDVLKQFGINWDALISVGQFSFGLATGNPVVSGGSFLTRGATNNNLFAGFNGNNLDLNALVDALNDEGLISVMAEPNLTALSGKSATFLAGGEFPIIVPDDGKVTIEFKQFGVSLRFTPTILANNRISLHVNPEVSQLTNTGAVEVSGFSIPALTTRRAETTVELGSGQSFAIAGLLQNSVRHDIDKFPGLGDVPVLGALFRSDRFQRNETELVIIVTPYVVKPVHASQIASPTDGLIQPTDRDRILHGRLYRPTPPSQRKGPLTPDREREAASIGFVLE